MSSVTDDGGEHLAPGTTARGEPTPPRVTFADHRRPVLDNGDYEVTVDQLIDLRPVAFTTSYSTTRTFTIAGERFALAPPAIREVFPPDGSLGDHSNVLPHVALVRPTLPWERDPGGKSDDPPPWLALLVLSSEEKFEQSVVTLGDLAAGPAYIPRPTLERHQAPTDRVTVMDVAVALLKELLPSYDDLRYLAHVRSGDGSDVAVVTGNRLPAPGVSTTVHLVSLEGRFHTPEHAVGPEFDFGPGGPDSMVRLVSLASWRFACVDAAQTFPRLVRDLSRDAGTLRLPDTSQPLADTFLRQGFVPARHHLRQGGRSVAWYRGPLTAGPVDAGPVPPVRTADALLRFHSPAGMFDVGYAAAWQLGRLLMLQSTDTATALYEWRRRRAQNRKRAAREQEGYPLAIREIEETLPTNVLAWLRGLAQLNGVPFGYLVPDERLLPVETIRFLGVDRTWMRHLVDGAYSIGRLNQDDADLDARSPLPIDHPLTTGALIRSDVVSGYPGLLVDAYGDETSDVPLKRLRCDRLSRDILLCLFEGELARLVLRQTPESRHLAVELAADGRTFGKTLRAVRGGSLPDGSAVPSLPLGPRRVLPLKDLVTAMAGVLGTDPASLTPGAFALQMIETAERVDFLRSNAR
ncbi:hypothetical protein ACIBHX_51980 [Nonomuraea sp. NPDC050536]|uniref:hypothetical protein n=1 Tax=Nonomuraea sp. NPDC050536 TaxID=3364366 RepID=UPI0037C6EE3C